MIYLYVGADRSCADDIFYLKPFLLDGEVAPSYCLVFAGINEIIQGRDGKPYGDTSNFRPVHFSTGDIILFLIT